MGGFGRYRINENGIFDPAISSFGEIMIIILTMMVSALRLIP
jgi:hypothetical protein